MTTSSEPPSPSRKRKYTIILLIALCALAAAVFSLTNRKEYGLEVRSYFADAQGLQAGAAVRLAGVNVGTVKSVRARPELKDHPAEVTLALRTPYILSVPADAIVSVAPSGIFEPTLVEIDVSNASAAPIAQGGVLRSMSVLTPGAEQLLQKIADIMNAKACGGNVTKPSANGKTSDEPPKSK